MLLLLMERAKLDKGIKNPEFAKAFGYDVEHEGCFYSSVLDLEFPEQHPKWQELVDTVLKQYPIYNSVSYYKDRQLLLGTSGG